MSEFWKESKWELGKHFELLTTDFDTEETIVKKCDLVKKYNMRTFLVAAHFVPLVAREFKDTDIYVGTGVGFPYGAELPVIKAHIVEEALKLGATTVDLSVNFAAMKAEYVAQVEEELRICREVARAVELKAIIEAPFLTDDEIRKVCELLVKYDYDWVKTATGHFLPVTMENVALILECTKGSNVKLKVSGVKAPRAQNAYAFMMAGAELIGSQKCHEIIDGLELLQKLGVVPSA